MSDTHAIVDELMLERVRAMSTTEKANVVHALSRTCIALARTGIKQRYPNATEYEVRMRLAVLMAGPDLIRAANGWDATLEGL